MNWDQIESNWKQLKGNIQQQWNRLTDDDLDAMDGKRDGLSGKIQETYGINKVEADHQLDTWQSTQNDPASLYNSDVKGEANRDMNSLSDVDNIDSADNTAHTNSFGYDDSVDKQKSHNSAGNAPENMQGGMGDNGPAKTGLKGSTSEESDFVYSRSDGSNSSKPNSDNPVSVKQNSGSSGSIIQGSQKATGSLGYNETDGDIAEDSMAYSSDLDGFGINSIGLNDNRLNNDGFDATDMDNSSTELNESANTNTGLNQRNLGLGDGAGIPGGDESDDDMDNLDNPIPPNPMPDDFDEPVKANSDTHTDAPIQKEKSKTEDYSQHSDETPHEEKSLDQT